MSIESVMPFSYLILCCPLLPPANFPSIRVFSTSHFFISGGQSIGDSASASVLPMNIQGQFPLGLTGVISLLSKNLLRVFSNTSYSFWCNFKWDCFHFFFLIIHCFRIKYSKFLEFILEFIEFCELIKFLKFIELIEFYILKIYRTHLLVENSERDGNTRPPDLPLEKPICRLRSNS